MKAPLTTNKARDSQSPVLVAIADTFIGGMGHPGSPIRVAASMEETFRRLPSEADRRRLRLIVGVLGLRSGTFLLTGRPVPFHRWSREQRVAAMSSWSTSRLAFRRQLFQVFKRLSLLAFLGDTEDDGTNPVWPEIGYPGPVSAPPPTPKSIRTTTLDGDTTLTCDAVVIGSGAGGGVVAGELSAAGKDVIVLEEGGYYNEADFNQLELSMMRKLYYQGGFAATADAAIALIAGGCLGGGTVINYTTSFRSPDWLRDEWANRYGLTAFATDDYTASMDAVYERLGVNVSHSRVSARERVLERGMQQLGWHTGYMPRNVQGCTQDARCGFCGYGCQIGAKQSTLKTYLQDAYRRRARIIVNCTVDRVLIEDGRAVGVRATVRQPEMPAFTLIVRSRAVVAAAGAIGTPALLQRSAVPSKAVGKSLRLHPSTAVSGIFDEVLRPWEGTLQALYSDEFANLDGQHFGPKIESAPLHPALLALVTPWRKPDQYSRLMRSLPNLSLTGILLRDSGAGQVITRDGIARVEYRLSRPDLVHMRKGIEAGVRILEAAGAKEIFTSQAAYVAYRPGQRGGVEAFMNEVDRHGYGPGHMGYVSFHQMGSCRMGIDPATSVIGPDHQAHAVKGLFVADGSAFPSASGVNPMITIMAMAHGASRYIAAAC
ncbi:MAG TPA: GMC family oxidoreductase N-terminal domain-containing protein [Candidatus Dormibacteraeota bacterium]|nr:GMC family oxidoreductase N-terminal domain-containing protein [Candidatus Dormibacteraeota bacterium]